jgi:hypothetical protein
MLSLPSSFLPSVLALRSAMLIPLITDHQPHVGGSLPTLPR